jgi:hypothetical protein
MAAPISTTYSPKERERIEQHILSQIALGRTLSKIIDEDRKEHGLPHISTWISWQVESEELHEKVARAREHGAERLVEEMVTISDDKAGDPDAQSRRVRIYAREKAAAMLAPRRFGQKLDVTSDGKALPAANVTINDNRIQSLLSLVDQRRLADQAGRLMLDD